MHPWHLSVAESHVSVFSVAVWLCCRRSAEPECCRSAAMSVLQAPAGFGVRWQVEGDWPDTWTDYSADFSRLLEDHFQSQAKEPLVERPRDSVIYHYYTLSYVQENRETNKWRAMRRIFVDMGIEPWRETTLMENIKKHNTEKHTLEACHTRTGRSTASKSRSPSRARSSSRPREPSSGSNVWHS